LPIRLLNNESMNVFKGRVNNVKKRPRFDDVPQDAMCLMMGRMTYAEPEYETRQEVREVNLGTDLSTLLAEIDTWPTKE
jgi:transposase